MGFDVALDSSNNAYVTGTAFSDDFPTPGGLQTVLAGAGTPPEQNPNVFVAKFNYTNAATPAESLVWSTYLGAEGDTTTADAGNGDGDLGFGIAVNPAGSEVYVVGQTYSGNSAFQRPSHFPAPPTAAHSDRPTSASMPTPTRATSRNSPAAAAQSTGPATSRVRTTPTSRASRCFLQIAQRPATDCQAYVVRCNPEHDGAGFPDHRNAFQSSLLGTNSKSNATFLVFHPDGSSLVYGTYYGGTGNGTNADARHRSSGR